MSYRFASWFVSQGFRFEFYYLSHWWSAHARLRSIFSICCFFSPFLLSFITIPYCSQSSISNASHVFVRNSHFFLKLQDQRLRDYLFYIICLYYRSYKGHKIKNNLKYNKRTHQPIKLYLQSHNVLLFEQKLYIMIKYLTLIPNF